ncbi:MAG: class I SAM-dependent methyltransferase, partial [Fibrobacteres bacterium]|nr:class I SAM-dependent methyltransferase [Fibrobacterota bacterium]
KGKVKAVKGHAEATSLFNESVDIIVSRSVLEHITNPSAAIREQARILKKGGVFIHFIDLRDHIFKWPFEMLTFSKQTWENSLTNPKNGAGYQNRLRSDDWFSLFSSINGFTDIKIDVLTENPNAFKSIKGRLDKEFSGKDPETLKAAIIILSGKKSI